MKFYEALTLLSSLLLGLGLFLTLIRLIKGPRLESRVVALDLMTAIGMGMIAVYAVMTEQLIFLDIAVVLALLTFLGTIAFAFYLEQQR